MGTDLFDLSGRVAVVTGGSRGLGREMVLASAERGADVVIASRKLEACDALAAEVRRLGRRAVAVAYTRDGGPTPIDSTRRSTASSADATCW